MRRKSREVRLPCVRDGKTSYPHVGDLGKEGVEFYHHGSKQSLCLPWMQMLAIGAEMNDCTPQQFLDYLYEIVRDSPSGPSAPTERRDAIEHPRLGRASGQP